MLPRLLIISSFPIFFSSLFLFNGFSDAFPIRSKRGFDFGVHVPHEPIGLSTIQPDFVSRAIAVSNTDTPFDRTLDSYSITKYDDILVITVAWVFSLVGVSIPYFLARKLIIILVVALNEYRRSEGPKRLRITVEVLRADDTTSSYVLEWPKRDNHSVGENELEVREMNDDPAIGLAPLGTSDLMGESPDITRQTDSLSEYFDVRE